MSAAEGQRASTGRGRQAGRKGALTGESDGGCHSRGRSSDTQGASRGSFWRGAAGGPADADGPCADGRGSRGPTGLNQRPAHQEPARAPRGLSACSPALGARGPCCPEAPRAGSLRCPVSARRKCRGQGEGSRPSAGGGGGQGPQKLPQASEVSALPPRHRPEPRSLHRLQASPAVLRSQRRGQVA